MKVSALIAPALAGLAFAESPTSLTIASAQTSGNGCPQGSVSTTISPDKTLVTFGFDSFQATIGPKSPAADKQKNCQIHLDLRYPSGFQVSLLTATYHGYARLDAGVTANFISSYYFSAAAANTASSKTTLSGAQFASGTIYTKEDKIQSASVVWSPCGANGILNVNNRIALTSSNSRAEGEISNDDATLKFEQQVLLQWRRCYSDNDGNNSSPNPPSNPSPPWNPQPQQPSNPWNPQPQQPSNPWNPQPQQPSRPQPGRPGNNNNFPGRPGNNNNNAGGVFTSTNGNVGSTFTIG